MQKYKEYAAGRVSSFVYRRGAIFPAGTAIAGPSGTNTTRVSAIIYSSITTTSITPAKIEMKPAAINEY